MASSALFYLVVLIALVVYCESFTLQTGLSRIATTSSLQDSSIKTSPVSSIMMTTIESVSNQVQLGRVTMYKKEGCPYCKLAAELLTEKYGITVTFVDIETPEKRDDILQQMRTFSGGRNTVPQIFFNSDHIGGNDDLQKLDVDGKLETKLSDVRKNAVSYMQDGWYHPWY